MICTEEESVIEIHGCITMSRWKRKMSDREEGIR